MEYQKVKIRSYHSLLVQEPDFDICLRILVVSVPVPLFLFQPVRILPVYVSAMPCKDQADQHMASALCRDTKGRY